MKRIITLCLMAIACLAMQAQDNGKTVIVLAKSQGIWSQRPQAETDKKTKKTTAVWENTENNSWHKDVGFIDDVPTATDFDTLFPDMPRLSTTDTFGPMLWQLSNEGDETVLHCYFLMYTDIVKNLWLCSDECVILDKQTGTIYQSRRTVPADCYGKVFSVRGKKGTALDFQIYFPQLPETTREIAIYGVPNWHMRGWDATLTRPQSDISQYTANAVYYDTIPQFHKPRFVSPAKDYDKDNHTTWAIYDDPHLIKPVENGTMAIWRTKEATYLAVATEMNWMREYFGRGGNNILIDERGHQYKCKDVMDYPNDELFWVEGCSGDYFAIVQVFEPIPLQLETITFIAPEGEPFAMWGANWSGEVKPNLDIKTLRQNQKLFKYHPRTVVK